MTQPLNYTVKAIECLAALDETAPPLSRIGIRYLVSMLRQAQVFVLPDHAMLLDRAKPRPEVPGITFTPPFPVVALEYAAPPEKARTTPGYTDSPSSRRISLAWRWTNDLPSELRACLPREPEDGVTVASIAYVDQAQTWVPIAAAAHFGFDDEWMPYAAPMPYVEAAFASGQISRSALGAKARTYSLIPLLPDTIAMASATVGQDVLMDHIASDLMDEISAYSDLCYALSCGNVSSERHTASDKLNKARIRRGNLPFKDFHVLSLRGADGTFGAGDGGGSGDRRAHLRRGHIRQLRHLGAGRMTWVNAAMVSGRGFVDKVYAL